MAARLHYFNGRGLAEKIRIMLCVSGIEFEDVLLTQRSQMLDLINEGKLLFAQLPLLEIDGINLIQSGAAMRYLATKYKMYGTTAEQQARIDMLYEGSNDFYLGILVRYAGTQEEMLKSATEKIPRYMPVFEKVLKDNGTGYLVGETVTLADVGVFHVLQNFEDVFGDELYKDYPNIKAFMAKMRALPAIQLYSTKYKKAFINDDYIKETKIVMGRI